MIKAKTREPWECAICFKLTTDWPNNASPVNNKRCCDECNNRIVIPARIQFAQNHAIEPKK